MGEVRGGMDPELLTVVQYFPQLVTILNPLVSCHSH